MTAPPAPSPGDTTTDRLYDEEVVSARTGALFAALMLLFLLLAAWRASTAGFGLLTAALCLLSAFFLFYLLNYRKLVIRMTARSLELRFGLFTRTVPFDAMQECYPDGTSLWRIGGAGIHFSSFRGRYRAMFNFLEHPRVVVALKRPPGRVREIAFSTRRPQEVLRLIRGRLGHPVPDAGSSHRHGKRE